MYLLLTQLRLFLGAIVVFSFVSSTTSAAVVAAGTPDLSIGGTIVDLVLFIPGVTASLVTFLVFGTAKSWRQYRDLLVSGCRVRKKQLERSIVQTNGANQDQPLEFERLSSLQTTLSAEERTRTEEAKNRVKMFSREVRKSSDATTTNNVIDTRLESIGPSFHRPNPSNSKFQFHVPRPSISHPHQRALSTTSRNIRVGLTIDPEDQVIQAGPSHPEGQGGTSPQHIEQPRTYFA